MAEYKEYKCELCSYTVAANPKGHDVVMMGEVYSYKCEDCHEIVNVLASEKTVCPECGSEKAGGGWWVKITVSVRSTSSAPRYASS